MGTQNGTSLTTYPGLASQSNDAWVVWRALAILAVLTGIHQLQIFPAIYSTSLFTLVGIILVCCGAIMLVSIRQISSGQTGGRYSPWLRSCIMFFAGVLLLMVVGFGYEVLATGLTSFELHFTPYLVATAAGHGLGALFSYAVLHRRVVNLSVKTAAFLVLMWYVLSHVAVSILKPLFFGAFDLEFFILGLIAPYVSLPTLALLLILAGLEVLLAYHVSKGVTLPQRTPRTSRSAWLGDMFCDLIDGHLSLSRTFWYVAMVGGSLLAQFILIITALNAPRILVSLALWLAAIIWCFLFIRMIQAGARFAGATLWEVAAVIIVGAQMLGYLIPALLLLI